MRITIGKIILDDWFANEYSIDQFETIWKRFLYPKPVDPTVPSLYVAVRQNMVDNTKCYGNFYGELSFLHNYFPKEIVGDLEFAKKYVDDFLIKMSGLTAFL